MKSFKPISNIEPKAVLALMSTSTGIRSREREQKSAPPPVSKLIHPLTLVLPKNIFVTNQGTSVPQVPLTNVQKNKIWQSATPKDALHFLQDGKFISAEALSLLVVGSLRIGFPEGLPITPL